MVVDTVVVGIVDTVDFVELVVVFDIVGSVVVDTEFAVELVADIVDFVDIEKEYNSTLNAYIKELEEDMNSDSDDEVSLSGLVVDKDDIKKKYDKLSAELKQFIPNDNIEQFVQMMQYLIFTSFVKDVSWLDIMLRLISVL